MRNFTFLFAILSAALFFTSCEDDFFGIDDSGIFGVVRDAETGNPIPFANVFINGPEARNIQADGNGNYRIDHLRTGNYVVSAEAYRYLPIYQNTSVILGQFTQTNIDMEFHSLLSTHVLDFGTGVDELEIVVTNILDRPIDVDTDEDENWMTVNSFISGLDPGQSDIITVKINRSFLDAGTYSVPLVVDIEEDFGFDIYESYVVTVNVEE